MEEKRDGTGMTMAQPAGRDLVHLLGVPVDRVTMAGALARVVEFMAEDRSHLIFTPNPEIIDRAQRDPGLLDVLRQADLAIPDSVLIVLASRWAGRPVPERVTGVDLTGHVLEEAAKQGWTVFLLGAKPGVAEKAAARALALYPGLRVAGSRHGYFPSSSEAGAAVAAEIRASGAGVVMAGMGAPKQERWMLEHGAATGARVLIGVGGSLDVLSGEVERAPVWVQRVYLEWLYRLLREPSRWRRMSALPRFAWAAWRLGRSRQRGG